MRAPRAVPKKGNPTFALVVDGECEVWYFNMLHRHERGSIKINITPRIPQKKSLKDQYESVKDQAKDSDKVFWVVDLDVILSEARVAKSGEENRMQEFIRYRNELEKLDNVVIITNSPCLEFWLLLHFEFTAKKFANCDAAGKHLKKHLKDYEKSQAYFTKQGNDIYLRLKPYFATAIANAQKLGKFDASEEDKSIAEMMLFFGAAEFKEHFIKTEEPKDKKNP